MGRLVKRTLRASIVLLILGIVSLLQVKEPKVGPLLRLRDSVQSGKMVDEKTHGLSLSEEQQVTVKAWLEGHGKTFGRGPEKGQVDEQPPEQLNHARKRNHFWRKAIQKR